MWMQKKEPKYNATQQANMASQHYPFQISTSMSSSCIAHNFQRWCNNVYQMLY